MLEILTHVADTHLRDAQYGRLSRGDDYLKAFLNAIEVTAERGIKLMVHGGDFFNASAPTPEVVAQLLDVNAALRKHGITLVTVSGNHERTAANARNNWLEVFNETAEHVSTDSDAPQWFITNIDYQRFETKTPAGNLSIFGYPSCSGSEMRQFLLDATAPSADILLWHGAVKEFADFPSMDAVSIAEFAACPRFKTVLLGDIHVHRYFALRENGIIGYPGSTELTKGDEEIEKAIGVVYWDGKETFRVAKHVIKTRRVLTLRVADEPSLVDAVNQIAATRADAPIIILRYNPALTDAMGRVYMAMHPDSILRASRMTEAVAPNVAPAAALSTIPAQDAALPERAAEIKSVAAFLPTYVPDGTPLHTVAAACLDPSNKPTQLLTEYVDRVINPTCAQPASN